MGLRNLRPIDSGQMIKGVDRLFLMEEILSDGSKAYQIRIFQGFDHVEIDCINEESAIALFTMLDNQSDYNIAWEK